MAMPERERLVSGAAVALVHVALGYALLNALITEHRAAPVATPTLLTNVPLAPPPPPPHTTEQHKPTHLQPAAPAPAKVVRPSPSPAPVIATPSLIQTMASAGGGGNGVGGGNGTGGNGEGDGDGDGGGTPPEHVDGRIKNQDYPRALSSAGIGGTVGVRYRVNVDGRVSDCAVTRSSGNGQLDALTCNLITKRFRFRPSLDADGRPVSAIIVENHIWEVPAIAGPDDGGDDR
jgi:periplasmic protein TonB